MKQQAHFSSSEIEATIAQLEAIMVHIKRQTTDQPEALRQAFPTLSHSRMDQLLSEPLTADKIVAQTKELIQSLIAKTY